MTTNAASAGDDRPPLLAVALLSAAALGGEVLLIRLFSIVQWHHFAYMMISVALLGYGAAGTFVTLARDAVLARYAQIFVVAAVLFGATAVASFLLAQRVGFDPLELLWDPQQPLRLLFVYVLLFVPFFCAATALCATFARFGADAPLVYGADIVGGGAGVLAVVAELFAVSPMTALRFTGALGGIAAAAAALHCRLHPRVLVPLSVGGALVLAFAAPSDWMQLRPSQFKPLSQALALRGAHVVAERSSPLGLVTVVDSPEAPLRHAPGLSLASPAEPPAQLGVFVDGEGPSALTRFDGDPKPLAYLDYLTSAAPYHLLDRPRVLVLGAGAGTEVLQALAHDARTIDAVELDPQLIELVERDFGAFSGRPFSAPGVRVHVAEARGFVARNRERFDLIEVALLDAFGTSAAGLHGLAESYVYTVEALETYVERLAPGGVLAITRWVNLPPRDVLKLVATASAALERRGSGEPGRQLALIRSWSTATLLVKNGPFTTEEIAALREFCRARSFDADYFPGIAPGEANRYNVLDASYFRDGALALLGPDRARFVERYKFDLTPATDDRPYFFHFFRWRTLPELLATKAQGALPLLEWGYPVLIATLAQATLASVLLIALPLAFALRRTRLPARPSRTAVALYFGAIGFAFMFIEIAFIQKLALFLAHPLYAVAVVLAAFLVCAGFGSRWSARLAGAGRAGAPRLGVPVAVIAALAFAYVPLLPELVRYAMPLPDAARIAVAVALIAPLGFAMGMPFPLGLARLAASAEPLVPWAWGVNACASVVAAVLATVLAIHFGFVAVVALAVLLYAAAFVVWR